MGLQQRGMDVGFLADRRCVAELLRHRLDDRGGAFLRFAPCCAVELAQLGKRVDASRPGPEVFRGEVLARYLAQEVVHVRGTH